MNASWGWLARAILTGDQRNLKRGGKENELKGKTTKLFYLNGCAEDYTE